MLINKIGDLWKTHYTPWSSVGEGEKDRKALLLMMLITLPFVIGIGGLHLVSRYETKSRLGREAVIERVLERADTNKNGRLDQGELERIYKTIHKQAN